MGAPVRLRGLLLIATVPPGGVFLIATALGAHPALAANPTPAASPTAHASPAAPDGWQADRINVYRSWTSYTTRDGLPDNRIRTIRVFDDDVWVGTDRGLALRRGGRWTSWTTRDGLAWPAVSAIDVDPDTRTLWLGTWGGGLVRFSGGRFDRFDQLNSGLAGNLVFAVAVRDGRVWAATNAGLSMLDTATGTWNLYYERRADAPDTAITQLSIDGHDLLAVAWLDSIQRFDHVRNAWMPFHCPAAGPDAADDPGDAMLGMATGAGSIWGATLHALVRCDGQHIWRHRLDGDLPVPGHVIRCMAATGGARIHVGTDDGLYALVDEQHDTWLSYRTCDQAGDTASTGDSQRLMATAGCVIVSRGGTVIDRRALNGTIPDDRIRCVAVQGADLWVGTAAGLARATDPGPVVSLAPFDPAGAPATHVLARHDRHSVARDGTPPRHATATATRAATPPVSIAILGPANRTIALPGDTLHPASRSRRPDLLAVQLAVEHANAAGGYRGQADFVLADLPEDYTFSNYGWGTPEDELLLFADRLGVRAMITHLRPRDRAMSFAILGTEIPVINAAPTGSDVESGVNPWLFQWPRDRDPRPQCHEPVIHYLFGTMGLTRLAVIRTPSRDAREHLDAWVAEARKRGRPPVADLTYTDDLTDLLGTLRERRAQAVLTWCDLTTSARIIHAIRHAGMDQVFVGGDALVVDAFADAVGPTPGRVIAVIGPRGNDGLGGGSMSGDLARFIDDYASRNYVGPSKRRPGPNAFRSYRATRLLLEAINIAGTDRRAIRRVLTRMTRAGIARWQHGRWTYDTPG